MEAARGVPVEALVSLESDDINYEKFDISLIYEKANKRLDAQQEKLNES